MRTTTWRRALTIFCAPVLALTALVLAAPAAQAATTLNAVAQGWYQETGLHDTINLNYFTGRNYGLHHRSYVAFDLSAVTGTVEAATFRAPNPSAYGTQEHSMSLREVTTTLTALNTSYLAADPTGQAIYQDLGDGTIYGTYPLSDYAADPVVVQLNEAGVAAVNANLGGVITLGTDIPSNLQTYNFLFGATDETFVPELVLQLADSNGAPVVGTVTISPDPAVAGNVTFLATPAGFSDPDGDPLTYHYAWTVNGINAGTDSDTLVQTVYADDLVAVSATASDGQTSSTSATDQITVVAPPSGDLTTAIAHLRSDVVSYDLGKVENRLVKLLDGTVKDIDKGDLDRAIEKMNSFIAMVDAQAGKQISTSEAEHLVIHADEIITLLQNR